MPWVDPTKDIGAIEKEIQIGLTTQKRELAKRGVDFEDWCAEKQQEKETLERYGLEAPMAEDAPQPEMKPEEDDAPLVEGMQAVKPQQSDTQARALVDFISSVFLPKDSDGDDAIAPEVLPTVERACCGDCEDKEKEDENITINISINGNQLMASPDSGEDEEEYGEMAEMAIGDYSLLPGFSPARELFGERKIKAKKAKNCSNGQVCGFSCISKTKTCISNMTTAQLKEHNAAKKAAKSGGAGEAIAEPQSTPLAGTLAELTPDQIKVDPKRFQYKIIGEYTKTGEVGSLSGVQRYDPNLAGIIQVWQDPADGETYVVNGHNRLALANRLGAEKVAVRYLDVKDATEARAVGALTNIAEGRGTPLDAAKFFNDTGLSKADLDAKGIPMREKIATDGLALSKLEPALFRQVINGDLSTERGVIIGGSGLDGVQQKSLVELIGKQPKNKNITNEVVSELVDTVKASTSQTNFVLDLFGGSDVTVNNAIEKAKLQAQIKKKLSKDKKLFGTVSKSTAAKQLEAAGNVIDIATSSKISMDAAKTLAVFDSLKNLSGPISSKINEAATAIQNGGNAKKIQSDLYKEISQLVSAGTF
jgi:hypothetical protein